MTYGLGQKIFERELATTLSTRRAYRNLYGDHNLVRELDIVNELDGHSGCVNALSWSRSGRLLASGSDDQHLNIHVYQPEDSNKQFQLHTTVATGHTQNIFSVKFMPQSDDRTVVTCAGDGEVRVFDLEYAGQTTEASNASVRASTGRRARRNNVYNGVRYLSDGDTNARVYRSHGDRVKRIVTEQSPYHFLTCSEDGEIRQWDTRQPSSAYPGASRYTGTRDERPPPLISYQRYNLDLNTISCASSQPHYIALGGAHLHCFLHDRRMAGRDLAREKGRPGSSPRSDDDDDEEMVQATRCVRKFAPQGQQEMDPGARGHITACKISEARPDEMIVSWSADHIYSFDLIRSPDASERITRSKTASGFSGARKRKRKVVDGLTSQTQHALNSTQAVQNDGETFLRVNYENGQSENIAIADDNGPRPLTNVQCQAKQIADAFLHIRKTFFKPAVGEGLDVRFSHTLGLCASLLPEIDEVLRSWTYPLDASSEQVAMQQKLRTIRESVRRLVQAAGTISRVLGARLQTVNGLSPRMSSFLTIDNRTSDLKLSKHDQLCFDLIKAILVWLDSGRGKLIEEFTRPNNMSQSSKAGSRLPIPEEQADSEAIEEWLIPYLTLLAEGIYDNVGKFVLDPEQNQFVTDEARTIYDDVDDAVQAFGRAVARPFADLSTTASNDDNTSGSIHEPDSPLDRRQAVQFWALRVSRGILLRLCSRLDYQMIEVAFGGVQSIPATAISNNAVLSQTSGGDNEITNYDVLQARYNDTPTDNGSAPLSGVAAFAAHNFDDMNDNDNNDDDDDDDEGNSSESDEGDEDPEIESTRYLNRSIVQSERSRLRSQVGAGVPCSSAMRTYKGHCNVQTVKDVNYFGLEDEYVVSGSDDGNLFIWDRKTSQLVNVLEGDGEVVNVVQGHPYETMLAVSGIDHTIKIFSPDSHARQIARLGRGVTAHDPSTFSSLQWPERHNARFHRRPASSTTHDDSTSEPVRSDYSIEEDDDYVADSGLPSRRMMHAAQRIMEQNNVDRRRGDDDAVLTRSMLHHLAQRMREHRAANGGNPDLPLEGFETGEDGRVRIVLGEDCAIM